MLNGITSHSLNCKKSLEMSFPLQNFISVKCGEVSPTMSLARYLREKLSLTGIKIMCGQAGCGACVVTAYVPKSNSEKGYEAISINSVRF